MQVKVGGLSPSMNLRKTLNPTLDLITQVLKNIGLKEGSFTLSVHDRQRQKSNAKFSAIRIDRNSVLVRCKPGANDTCYSWKLTPESGALGSMTLENFLEKLQLVHPKTLAVPVLQEEQVLKEEPSPVTIQTPKVLDGCGLLDVMGRPCGAKTKVVVTSPDGKKFAACEDHVNTKEWQKIVATAQPEEPTIKEKIEEVPQSVDFVQPEDDEVVVYNNLKISTDIKSMLDQEVLDKALIAACFVMEGGVGDRKQVTKSIVNELGLEEFCEKSPSYSDIWAAVRACIGGLVKEGSLKRSTFQARKQDRVHVGTQSYSITQWGRERIASLMDSVPDEIVKRLWSGQKPAPKSPDPHPNVNHADPTFEALEGAGVFDILRDKLAEYDKLNQEKNENLEMIELARKDALKPEIIVIGLTQKIEELQKELARIQLHLNELTSERSKATSKMAAELESVKELEDRNKEIDTQLQRIEEEIRKRTATQL